MNMQQSDTKKIGNGRILVVDDEEIIRNAFSWMISSMGFEVAVADSAEKALNQLLNGSVDLVLTDLNIPGTDGWTLAHHIKDISPETPVVMVTGEDRGRILKKMEDSAIDFVLFKPVRLKEVQETVQRMLQMH